MRKFVRAVDAFNSFFGKWIALLILPLTFVVVYEVAMRRLFRAPTTWAFEMTVYFYGAHFVLGAAYTHLHDRHVRIDISAQQFPAKVRLIVNLATFWLILVPFVGCLSCSGLPILRTQSSLALSRRLSGGAHGPKSSQWDLFQSLC